jgi:hypothetical protein
MPATPLISRNFKLAAIASLPSRLRRIKSKCYAWEIMLCLCDTSLSRTKFRAAYLLPIAWTASLLPVFEPGLVRAEINNAGAFAPCLLAAVDQAARPRSFEEAGPYTARDAIPAAASGGTWRLVI